MKAARVRALQKSIVECIDNAAVESNSPMALDYLDEARALIEILCEEFDDEEPEELNFD